MVEKQEFGWGQVGTESRIRNSKEKISMKNLFDPLEEQSRQSSNWIVSRRTWVFSIQKDIRQQNINNMNEKAFGTEMPPGDITPTAQNPLISQITVTTRFSGPIAPFAVAGTSPGARLHFAECWYSNTNQLSSSHKIPSSLNRRIHRFVCKSE
jgi:hypothetical protein